MEVRLDGRSAIITGASKGLGLAMAKEFAASGADVAILARRPDVLEEAKGIVSATARGRVATFSCDVGKAEEIKRTYDAVITTFGKVDIMVNNAGISRAMPFEEITDEMWHEDLELKLFQAIRFCRLVMPQMKERRWGRIINVLNIGAKAPRANGAPTAVSRAAGMALTSTCAAISVRDRTSRMTNSAPRWAPMCRSAAWARPKNSPRWPACWSPTMAALPPERRSTWTAARPRSCDHARRQGAPTPDPS